MTAEWRSRKIFQWKKIIIICGVYWAFFFSFSHSSVVLVCLWTWLGWLLSWEANKADAEQCDQWSSRVHREGTQGFTKAGLTTKGTKTSITFSCLDHGWDPKLGSIKPPTKDWSSEHQSPSHKSRLFQTSGVLIQNPPRGELLVRNQYSTWGGTLAHLLQRPVKSEKHKGLKSLSVLSSTDMPGGLLMQQRFKMGSSSQSWVQGH